MDTDNLVNLGSRRRDSPGNLDNKDTANTRYNMDRLESKDTASTRCNTGRTDYTPRHIPGPKQTMCSYSWSYSYRWDMNEYAHSMSHSRSNSMSNSKLNSKSYSKLDPMNART